MEKKKTTNPTVNIDIKEVMAATKEAASACYGVVAIAKRDETLRPDKQIKDDTIDGWKMIDRGEFVKTLKLKDCVKFEKRIGYSLKDGVHYRQIGEFIGNVYWEEITMEEYLRLKDEYVFSKI